MGVAPGFMDFPEGKILAEWHEFQNSEKVEPAYKNLLTRHSPERLSKSFPNFNPVFDRVRYSPKTGREVVLHDYSRIYKLRFPSEADIGAICEKLKSLPGVLFAEPNQIVYPGAVPNDPYFLGTTLPGPQWNLDRINMRDAWDLSKGNSSTLIAIVDGGIHHMDPEFLNKFTGDMGFPPTTSLWYGHGDAVASVAAAKTNNSFGIAGVDWHAILLSKLVHSTTYEVTNEVIANKIMEAIEVDADIINCSFAGGESAVMRQALGDAYKRGIVNVTIMGNDNSDTIIRYPGAHQQRMLSVGATGDASDNPRGVDGWRSGKGSNWGPHIDVAAPGTGIPHVNYKPGGDRHTRSNGTSLAAPHVSGTAGLMLAYYKDLFNEDLTNEDIYEIIKRSAKDIHVTGFDETSGYGLLDAKKALDMLTPPYVLLHRSTSGMDQGSTRLNMELVDFPGMADPFYPAIRPAVFDQSLFKGNKTNTAENI